MPHVEPPPALDEAVRALADAWEGGAAAVSSRVEELALDLVPATTFLLPTALPPTAPLPASAGGAGAP